LEVGSVLMLEREVAKGRLSHRCAPPRGREAVIRLHRRHQDYLTGASAANLRRRFAMNN
jgi:hypothetical protein